MKRTLTALALATLAATPLAAKDKDKPSAPPALYQAVVDCRTIADSAERLACFDRTVGAMAQASETKDLVVVDRETMRETRKGLFGFSLPKLKLFGGGAGDDDDVMQIESTITGIRDASDGHPIYTIADGARWKHTSGRIPFAKVGDKIRIRKAALGSYFANIDGGAGVKVMRLP